MAEGQTSPEAGATAACWVKKSAVAEPNNSSRQEIMKIISLRGHFHLKNDGKTPRFSFAFLRMGDKTS